MIDHLLREYETDFTRQPVIAYRDSHRLEQYFEPVKLDPVQGFGNRLKEKGRGVEHKGLGLAASGRPVLPAEVKWFRVKGFRG